MQWFLDKFPLCGHFGFVAINSLCKKFNFRINQYLDAFEYFDIRISGYFNPEFCITKLGHQFIFMDDNYPRPHRTRDVQNALENQNITRLEWPKLIFAAIGERMKITRKLFWGRFLWK